MLRVIAFYADKAGVPFPAASYTQVLVGEPAAQEAAGFALLSEGYGRRVLADPTATWLAAHGSWPAPADGAPNDVTRTPPSAVTANAPASPRRTVTVVVFMAQLLTVYGPTTAV